MQNSIYSYIYTYVLVAEKIQQTANNYIIYNKSLILYLFLFGGHLNHSLIIASTEVKINQITSYCQTAEFKGFHCSILIYSYVSAGPPSMV